MSKNLHAIILIFAVFLVPLTMRAATATELAANINSLFADVPGNPPQILTATVNGNTVIVTGLLQEYQSQDPRDIKFFMPMSLDIDEDVTVIWKANVRLYSGMEISSDALIYLTGLGTFDVTTDGEIYSLPSKISSIHSSSATIIVSGTGYVSSIQTDGNVEVKDDAGVNEIHARGTNSLIEVSGGWVGSIDMENVNNIGLNVIVSGGTLKADGYNHAIVTYGNVEVSGGEVLSAATAIEVKGDNSTVTVNGGLVAGKFAISVLNKNNTGLNVTVGGTGKVETMGIGSYAISTVGNVEVNGGEVTSNSGCAIFNGGVNSTVAISGGTVSGGGSEVIHAKDITVSGTAKIQATGNNYAIVTSGNVEMSGGEVTATEGIAIIVNGGLNSTVAISGGMVSSGGSEVIQAENVTVSGTAKIQATGNTTTAISASGNVEVSGGEVTATEGTAIIVNGDNSTVTVSGGLVFAYGSAITGSENVIRTENSIGFNGATGTGVVIAWNPKVNRTYSKGSSEDIFWSPASAKVQWDKNDSNDGISYTNGDNTGFIPLNVTVTSSSSACHVTFIESPEGATILDLMIMAFVTNNVTLQNILLTTSPNASWKLYSDAACTNEIPDKTMILALGDNTAYIQVTAEDGTTKIYTIVINRAEALTLSVSPASLNFAASGEQKTFDIASNTNWTIAVSDSWITVSPAAGNTDGTITVTAEANTETTPRTATITVSGTGVMEQTIDVNQDAAPIIPDLSVSTTSLNFAASGEQQTFTIASNTNWTVAVSDSWITVSPAAGNADGTITVTAEANTETTPRTATITVSGIVSDVNGDGVLDANDFTVIKTISITQDAAEVPSVILDETQTVGTDGKGTIALNLSVPSNATLTGSFEITFPSGMTLDEELTVLSLELSRNFYLVFSYKGNNTWLIEIKSNALRSSTSSEYTNIMAIAYTVSDSVSKGTYDATIKNLDFLLNNTTPIKEDLLTVPINIERSATSIESIGSSSFYAYFINNMLKIESSQKETITIYSATGIRLNSTKKNAGIIEIPFSSIPGSVYVVKGSKSGTIKVVK